MTMNNRFRILGLCVASVVVAACDADPGPAAPSKSASTSSIKPAEAKPLLPPRSLKEPSLALTSTAPAAPTSVLAKSSAKNRDEKAESSTPAPMPETGNEAPEPDYDRPLSTDDVTLERFVLATDVQGREPLDERDVFTTEEPKIFAFVQLSNPEDAPYAVRVHFEKLAGPETPYGIKLDVKTAPRWRTWAYTRIRREPGEYRAVLRTLEGEEIASRSFEIVPAD